jgi:predicted RNA binding protein YcfA (HicA-like mRNA interferase family)
VPEVALTRLEKLYMKVASSPANTRFQDVVQLAETVGFVLDRTSGSHHIFYHEDHPDAVLILQPRHGRAKEYQVKQLLELIDRLHLRGW